MKATFFCITFLMLCTTTFAQEPVKDSSNVSWDWYHITMKDGYEYVAQILSDDGREILIYTREVGKIYLLKSDVKKVEKIENTKQVIDGTYINAGPFTTRYYFINNAFPIKRGENYAMVHLWGPEVHFATTNNFSIGAMTTWIGSPFGVVGKYSFNSKDPKKCVSLGTIMATSGYLSQFRGFGGLHFANFTYGTRTSNITLSAGYGYYNTGFEELVYQEGYSVIWNDGAYPTVPYTEKYRTKGGILFGVSGLSKVGAKATFIFDVMTVFSQPNTTYVDQTTLSGGYYDSFTGTWIPGTYKTEVKTIDNRTTIIFMPGMRFQKTEQKAFQVAIAGVSVIDDEGSNTFPVPMCSWLFKF